MQFASLIAFLAAAAGAPAAPADAPASATSTAQRIHGKIEAYNPDTRTLSVATTTKTTVAVMLAPEVRVIYDAKRTLADLKAGDFIGASTLKAADGKLRAQEVHVFPDSMHGAGEGLYPQNDANPNRLMTNATVAEVAAVAPNKGSIKLTYRGAVAAADGSCTGRAGTGAGCTGNAEVTVAPGIPIIAIMTGDETLLIPGMTVSVSAATGTDGMLQSSRLSVEKDGVKPIF